MATVIPDEIERLVSDAEEGALEFVRRLRTLLATDARASEGEVVAMARTIYRRRRLRDRYFDSSLFGEPAWDILLDLFIARSEGKAVSVSSACIGAAVPQTTGLRWLGVLECKGLLRRRRRRGDERVTLVEISDEGNQAMESLLAWLVGQS